MSRACTICTHPQRDAIDAARRKRRSFRLIAEDFGLAETSVRRHFQLHVAQIVADEKAVQSAGRLTNEEHDGAQALFLADFARFGIVRHALEAAGISRNALYQWKEHDEAFSAHYHQAEHDANDALREEARRRAVEGTPSYVLNRGEIVMVTNDAGQRVPLIEQKYSDTLLIFEMKRRMPEYREKQQVEISGKDGGPIQSQQTVALDVRGMTPAQLAALRSVLEAGQ